MLNLPEITKFVNLLSESDPFFTFAFLGPYKSSGVIPGLATFQASVPDVIAKCQELESQGTLFTLHVTLNQCSDKGRKLPDVQSARVLCVDLDTPIEAETLQEYISRYYPHLVVESSPKKYHLYWKISPIIPLESWSYFQLALSELFGSDRTLAQKNKTIRVPGVSRVLADTSEFMPSIVFEGIATELDAESIALIFPDLDSLYSEATEKIKEERKLLAKIYKDRAATGDWKNLSSKTGRNNTLYASVRLFVANSEVEPTEAELLAYASNINNQFESPLPLQELESCIRSAAEKGRAARAKKLAKVAAEQAKLVVMVPGLVKEPEAVETEPTELESNVPAIYDRYTPFTAINYKTPALIAGRFSEIGVAERALQRFRDKMILIGKDLYAFDTGEKIWSRQSGESHRQLTEFAYFSALDTLIDPEFAANFARGEDGSVSPSKLKKAHEKFLGIGVVNKVSSFLLQSTGVAKGNHNTFDAKENLIYCSNGVLDMSNLELREARGDDYLLASTGVYWPAGVPENIDTIDFRDYCPEWIAFLNEVFEEKTELIDFIQSLFGYSISGSIAEQKIFCHYGDGSNGKSKLLAVLAQLSGGYGTYVDPDDMVTGKTGFVKAFERFGSKIEGRRCVIVDDIDVKTVWNESFVKNVTGDQIRARAEHEKSRLVANRAKIHLGLNVPPTPQAENYGLLRRLCLIPYNVRFTPNASKSVDLDRAFAAELPWIFVWAVAGYRKRLVTGELAYPAELDIAVEEYKANNFPIEQILRENFEVASGDDASHWVSLKDLANTLTEMHSAQTGERLEVTSNQIGRTLKITFGLTATNKRTISGLSKSVPLVRKAVG